MRKRLRSGFLMEAAQQSLRIRPCSRRIALVRSGSNQTGACWANSNHSGRGAMAADFLEAAAFQETAGPSAFVHCCTAHPVASRRRRRCEPFPSVSGWQLRVPVPEPARATLFVPEPAIRALWLLLIRGLAWYHGIRLFG